MRFDKRSRKLRAKKKQEGRSPRSVSFLSYLAVGLILLGLFYFVLYWGHEKGLRKMRQEKIQQDFDRICAALLLHHQDHGTYPSTDQGLDVLVRKNTGTAGSGEPAPGTGQPERFPLDPWGNPYAYRGSDTADGITLICWGSDGVQGGQEEAADVIRQGCRSTALPLH